jgi:ElaB/YqjD/DUF883 family membrane-anchored ribosome-binding protein
MKKPLLQVLRDLLKHRTEDIGTYEFVLESWIEEAAKEIERLQEKCNSRTRWLQTSLRERYEHLSDAAQEFADALFDEELEGEGRK